MGFPPPNALLEIVARTAIVYLALLVGLRLTGKRQVGQFTPFDLLLLLLLANAVQNAMVGPDTSLVGGVVAAAALFAVNTAAARFAWRSKGAARLFEGTPTLLIEQGRILDGNLAHEGISNEDLLRALREHGIDSVDSVRSAILEVDGSISVLKQDEMPTTPRPHHRIRGVPRRH